MLWSTRTSIYRPACQDGSVGAAPKNRPYEWAAIGRASHHHTGKNRGVDMLNSMKSSAPEKDKNAAANVTEVMGRTVQPHDQAWAKPGPTTKGASCLGSDMSIVGK